MPVATQQTPHSTVDAIKSSLKAVALGEPTHLTSQSADSSKLTRAYASFDATPSTGTEFRSVSTDGRPTLSIRDVLDNEQKLAQLGKLV